MTCFPVRIAVATPLFALYAMLLYGCTTPADSTHDALTGIPRSDVPAAESPPPPSPALTPGQPVATVIDARPAALIDGRGVMWGDIRSALSDAAGAEVLREVILDNVLTRRAKNEGLEVTDRELASEESLLLATLSDDPATSVHLLETLRSMRRLGPARYQRLLWRNAVLRSLVRDRVNISPAAIEQMRDMAYGPKRQVRVITTPDLRQAQYVIERLEGGAFFGDLAVEFSSDTSAARGGLLAPVGRLDPSYPAALLQAIWNLTGPGTVSDPILLDRSYAVVQLEREIEGAPPGGDGDERRKLESLVRLNQERVLMDEVARNIIADTPVTIFDDDLNEAWGRFRRASAPRSAQVP